MKLDFRQRLLASTLLATAGLIANPAYAQDSAQSTVPDQNQATNPGGAPATGDVAAQPTPTVSATGETVQQAQDIIVTGTRIPQPNLQSAAPVTVVSNRTSSFRVSPASTTFSTSFLQRRPARARVFRTPRRAPRKSTSATLAPSARCP